MTVRTSVAVALGILLVAGTAWAHHSTGALYDKAKIMTVTGTLTKIDWRNPHITLLVEVRGERGNAKLWALEGGSPIWYSRQARFDKSRFERFLGQTITVLMCPAFEDSPMGRALLHTMTFPDGTTLKSLGTGPFSFNGSPVNPDDVEGGCGA